MAREGSSKDVSASLPACLAATLPLPQGGAIGAILATLIFYPFDVAKTRLQAEADTGEGEEGEKAGVGAKPEAVPPATTTRASAPHLCHGERTYWGELKVFMRHPQLWYAGLGPKVQLALISSFLYFYCYATFKRLYSHGLKKELKFLPNLVLASLAGVANVLVTMPLDVVVTRLQVARAQRRERFLEVVRHIMREGPEKFWQGLVPALMLTLNPAINYAAFDAMKSIVGRARRRRPETREILVLGLFSKFLATLITYPLIRAKVMMMANINILQQGGEDEGDRSSGGEKGEEEPVGQPLVPKKQPDAAADMHLWQVLSRTVREEGLLGLYVGCDAQVINTALKNSLLLLTKEQISRLVTLILAVGRG